MTQHDGQGLDGSLKAVRVLLGPFPHNQTGCLWGPAPRHRGIDDRLVHRLQAGWELFPIDFRFAGSPTIHDPCRGHVADFYEWSDNGDRLSGSGIECRAARQAYCLVCRKRPTGTQTLTTV